MSSLVQAHRFTIALTCLFALGCASFPQSNPSMPVDSVSARAAIARMKRNPLPLARPLVVVSGFSDYGLPSDYLVPHFRAVSGDGRIIGVSMFGCHSFDLCADRVIAAVQKRFPSKDPTRTVPVDVVAVSMGGLVSRYAAVPRPGQRRLDIVRLFTISTPHQGANLAPLPAFEAVQTDMRPGSKFLAVLNRTRPPYPIYPYVRLGDFIVGARYAALPGEVAWWLPRDDISPAHGYAYTDDRIFLDIALRLRGETPVSTLPRAPLPR